jgi:hypothetical protein
MRRVGLLDILKRGWTLDGVARPWPAGVSIFQHLAAHTKDGVLDAAGFDLPMAEDRGDIAWAHGARDGILAHHVGETGAEEEKAAMLAALLDVFREPTAAHLSALYTRSTEGHLAGYVDGLVDLLNETPDMDAVRVHGLGKMLATEAPHLEAVKLGITLLGMVENDDRAVLLQLALHDELTLFAVLALVKQNDDFEPLVFDLAKRVHGWGRIHTIERLADTTSPAIKAWLLRDGFRNTVMDEYLAQLCAVTGELHVALAKKPDAALLSGAAGIFRAIAAGAPGPDFSEYEQANAAIAAWLPHVAPDLESLVALDALASRDEIPAALRAQIEVLRTSDTARAIRTAAASELASPTLH